MAPITFEKPPASLCILRLSAIGDVTHMLPIIATLQQQWPNTKITWIIGLMEYQLVKSLKGIEFIVFNKKNGFAEFLTLREKLSGRKFDILLMMQVALRASLISLQLKAPIRIGYDSERSRDFQSLFCNHAIEGPNRVHVLDTFFQFLQKIGIHQRRMDWLLQADDKDREFASEVSGSRPYVVINPCSSTRKNNWRNWSVERYAEIVDYLGDKDIQVVLSGGPDVMEREMSKNIFHRCGNRPIDLVGKTTLIQLLALIERSICLIAPDTGPAHLGTVAGVPVIGLYASSNPQRTGPYNSKDNTINRYPQALQKYDGKTVLQSAWGKRVRHPEVMDMITVEDVKDKLDQLI